MELTNKQQIAIGVAQVGISITGAYFGINNWKKNGWWKTLSVVSVISTGNGVVKLAQDISAPKK